MIMRISRTMTSHGKAGLFHYSTVTPNVKKKPTSQIYFQKIFLNKLIKYDKCICYCNKYWQCFQSKILDNILYSNKKLCTFVWTWVQLIFSVKLKMKLHYMYPSHLQLFLEPDVTLPYLLIQAAIFGFPK